MKSTHNFIINKDGALSIEFAGCIFLFTILLFIIYDIYSSIALQNRLERANYTVASLFRERTSLYPAIDDTVASASNLSLCQKSGQSCFLSYELFDQAQTDELSRVASLLLDRPVAVDIDTLFILQDSNHPADLSKAQLVSLESRSCLSDSCDQNIDNYFNSLPSMDDNSLTSLNNYSQLAPYVPRISSPKAPGRWIPIYRVSLCVINEESLYLKWINSNRNQDDFLPNLCSNFIVLSRCNNIASPTQDCPVYFR